MLRVDLRQLTAVLWSSSDLVSMETAGGLQWWVGHLVRGDNLERRDTNF